MFDEHARDCVIPVEHNCNYGPASCHLEDRARGLPGQYTWKLDQALSGQHTLRLYGVFSSEQASILIQALFEQDTAVLTSIYPV
jgi:hypothetical protein